MKLVRCPGSSNTKYVKHSTSPAGKKCQLQDDVAAEIRLETCSGILTGGKGTQCQELRKKGRESEKLTITIAELQ